MASPKMVSFTAPTDYSVEQERIARNRQMAQMLQADADKPLDMPTQPGVRISPLSGLAKMLKAYSARSAIDTTDKEAKSLGERRNTALVDALRGMPRARSEALPTDQEGTGSFDMAGTNTPSQIVQPTMADNAGWLAKLGQVGPDAVAMGGTVLGMQQRADEGAENRQARLQERIMVLDAASQQQGLAREERTARAAEAAALRRELQESQQTFARSQSESQRAFQLQQAADARANRQPQVIQGPDGPMQMVGGKAVPILGPDNKPIKSAKAQGPETQKVSDAISAMEITDLATPLLDKAHGSYIGAGMGQLANVVGMSSEANQADAQLKVLAGQLVSKMPKMSGPQSDKDVMLYREMAGQIGDQTLPASTRKAAIKTIRELNTKYATEGGYTPPAVPAAPVQTATNRFPRAKNPTTGQELEWNGQAWVPAQ